VAPIFMMIFGYFVFAGLKTTKELFARGVKIFALGMFLNIALNFNLIVKVYKGIIQINIWPYVFGVDVLQFAGLSLILIASFKFLLKSNVFVVLLIIPLIFFIGEFVLVTPPTNYVFKYLSAFFMEVQLGLISLYSLGLLILYQG